jgi:hypothetical protein
MKTETNEDKYYDRSKSFLQWLDKWLDSSISSSSKLKGTKKEELKEALLWNISSLLDGSGNLEHEGKALIPFLGFQVDGE